MSLNYYLKHIFICTNQKADGKQCCASSGGKVFFEYLKKKLVEMDLHGPDKIRLSQSGCLGRCSLGPTIVIYPEGVWYSYSTFEDLDDIVATHLVKGKILEKLLLT